MIEIIPAIDIMGGRAVRLTKGEYSTVKEYGDPLEMARIFADNGARRLHLVDLDGAKSSEPVNLPVLESIAGLGILQIEWGGGLKSRAALQSVIDAGASYMIIGSLAALEPETFENWLAEYGSGKLIFGADISHGELRVKGWTESARAGLDELLGRFSKAGLRRVICTDISRDGMLNGPSAEMYGRLAAGFPTIEFTVSGGISSMEDIRTLDTMGLPAVIAGKAYYEGHITIGELRKWWLNE